MKNIISTLFITTLMVSLCTSGVTAAERKPIEDVDVDSFTSDTQVTPRGSGDDHLAIAWWMPSEFWESILSRDTSSSEADKQAMLDAMSGVSLFAIAQADVSALGAFSFYAKDQIEETMQLTFESAGGSKQKLSLVEAIDPDLAAVLGVFKPLLEAAMGNLGKNMHFYVLNDTTDSSARLMDPYLQGRIDIQLQKKDETLMDGSIEMPVNALFIPRQCPNGKEAHVSWQYCPWSGQKLED